MVYKKIFNLYDFSEKKLVSSPELLNEIADLYIFNNKEYFYSKWVEFSKLTFNLNSFLLGPIYFSFRKMYTMSAIFCLIFVFTLYLGTEYYFLSEDRIMYAFLSYSGLVLPFSFLFNFIYSLKVKHTILKIDQYCDDADRKKTLAERLGGCSIKAAGVVSIFLLLSVYWFIEN